MKNEVLNEIYNSYNELWKDLEIGYEMDIKKINKIWEFIQLYELLSNEYLTNNERLKIENSYGMWL